MADEAFALSPIAARAALPSEADYDAIREAFMETSRGRWFLAEYARRNRNADTRMVLDAVARIEENLAAQNDVPEQRAAEILVAVSAAVLEARAAASEAASRDLHEAVAPIRSGAEVIRGIISRLREIGADGRIYDLIETQVGAIERGCEQLAARDGGAALAAALDLIDQRIGQLTDPHSTSSSGAAEPPAASSAAAAAPPQREPQAVTDAELTLDDAVLDMIALEMAAPDLDEADILEPAVAETNLAEAWIVEQPAQPAVEPDPPAVEPDPPAVESDPPAPSLGASLIANGIVQKGGAGADPLAPLRRMSQAERIAFFS